MVCAKPIKKAAGVTFGCFRGGVEGFRQFLLRGKVVDLLIAVVIGTAFTAVVKAFVTDIVTPTIAACFGNPNFASLYFTINKSRFLYGDFLNQLLTFLLIALIVYFLVVLPMTSLAARIWKEDPKQKCPFCKSSIALGVTKCAFCCSELPPHAPPIQKELSKTLHAQQKLLTAPPVHPDETLALAV